jgi:hypothetical protein
MPSIDEYKDITTHLRARHQTIWHTRNIYTIIMLALVGITYQLELSGRSLIVAVTAFAFAGMAMTIIETIIEYRYAVINRVLTKRAIVLEEELQYAQYTQIETLKQTHRLAFSKRAQTIYFLLALAYIGAIVARGFMS